MRRTVSAVLGAMAVMALSASLIANQATGDRYTFARPPAPESVVDASRLGFVIERWATDEERDHVKKYLDENGMANLPRAFYNTPNAGHLSWPGGLEYGVRYARRTTRADGGSDIVLVLDRPVWVWWDGSAKPSDLPAAVVQLRLDKNGRGEGRLSHGGVGAKTDPALGVTLTDYAQAPAILTDVRLEPAGRNT